MKYRIDVFFDRRNVQCDPEDGHRFAELHADSSDEAVVTFILQVKKNEPTLGDIRKVDVEKVGV